MRFAIAFSFWASTSLVAGCHCASKPPANASGPRCATLGAPAQQATLDDPSIDEASGLVVSQTHPGIGWTHNDSGDGPRLFAIELATGVTVADYALAGIEAIDWEDISLSPGRGEQPSMLYIADTGDNLRRRDQVEVHRFEEPRALVANGLIHDVQTMRIRYPEGSRDVECLSVLPDGGLVLLTKTLAFSTSVYHVESWQRDTTAAARLAGAIPLRLSGSARADRVTGCDLSEEHGLFVVRTYKHALVFEGVRPMTVESLLREPPCVAKLPRQEQGESIALSRETPPQLFLISEYVGEPIWKIPMTTRPATGPQTPASITPPTPE